MIIKQSLLLVSKLSVILKALKTSFDKLKAHYCSFEKKLTIELENICKDIMNSLSDQDFIINEEIFIQALNLVDYFNRHKIALAGYNS
jgi:hypothetical protein